MHSSGLGNNMNCIISDKYLKRQRVCLILHVSSIDEAGVNFYPSSANEGLKTGLLFLLKNQLIKIQISSYVYFLRIVVSLFFAIIIFFTRINK